MPQARLPRRPLAARLWLWRQLRQKDKPEPSAAATAHTLIAAMNLETFRRTVRVRARALFRNTRLVGLLGAIVLAGTIWAALHLTLAPTQMRVAAGPPGSAEVNLVEMLSRKFAAEHAKVRFRLVATDGPRASAAAIAGGEADLAVLPSTLRDAIDWPVIAILRKNVMALIVPTLPARKETVPSPAAKHASAPQGDAATPPTQAADTSNAAKAEPAEQSDNTTKAADAKPDDTTDKAVDTGDSADKSSKGGGDAADANKLDSVAKLAGHRIGVVGGNAASREILGVVLGHYGVPLEQVEITLIDPSRVAQAVRAREVDVLFVAGAETGQAINDVVAAATIEGRAPSFIPIDQAEGMAKRNPAFQSVDIEAGTFGGHPPSPAETFKSLSFPEYLVAKRSFHHDAVATLSKLIFTSRLALAAAMPGEIKIQAPATDKDAGVVVHPGALAYLNDDQKTFFDRYGDDIFYGLLIFPIFGSALAAMAGYFRRGNRLRRLRLLQRLLDLTQKANHAPSLEALDKLQVDVDHLVVAIIHQTEHEEYDAGMQTSFALALDQVRFAISSRRTVLIGHGRAEAQPGAQAGAAPGRSMRLETAD